jgi:hypothetical protein
LKQPEALNPCTTLNFSKARKSVELANQLHTQTIELHNENKQNSLHNSIFIDG